MGGAKSGNPRGVRPHGAAIQITFHWNRERIAATYPHSPTPANLKRAAALRERIVAQIKAGVFTPELFAQHFPNSRRAIESTKPLFQDMAQRWLDSVTVSHNTREEYKKSLNRYWMPALALRPIDTVLPSELKALVNGIEWSSPKTRNNALIPLRGVFELAYDDELMDKNPAARLKNLKHQKTPPDPFSRDEAERIVAYLFDSYSGPEHVYAAYFELAFFSGLRTSELLALQWTDIDWHRHTVRVSKARSKGMLASRTKTAKERDVHLNQRGLHALRVMKALTFLEGGYIFKAPRTGEIWSTDKGPRKVFTGVLKRMGIRHRPAYNTRHTYATMLLMEGVNPVLVAQQLGHSVMMTLTVYSRWISGESDKKELGKLSFIVPERAKNAPSTS